MIVDRRAAYYARAADHIAADPLHFYTRAERGRAYQSGKWRPIPRRAPGNVVRLDVRPRLTGAA